MTSGMKRFLLFLSAVAWTLTIVLLFNVFTKDDEIDQKSRTGDTPSAELIDHTVGSTAHDQGILPVLLGADKKVLNYHSCIRVVRLSQILKDDYGALKKFGFECIKADGSEYQQYDLSSALHFCRNNRGLKLFFGFSKKCS